MAHLLIISYVNSQKDFSNHQLHQLNHQLHQLNHQILISSISDHYPYFNCPDYNKPINNIPKFIKIRKYDTDCLNQFKTELINSTQAQTLITQRITRPITFTDKLYSRNKQTPIHAAEYVTLKTNIHTNNAIRNIRLNKCIINPVVYD